MIFIVKSRFANLLTPLVSYMTIFSNSCHSILGDRLSSPYRKHNRQVVHN